RSDGAGGPARPRHRPRDALDAARCGARRGGDRAPGARRRRGPAAERGAERRTMTAATLLATVGGLLAGVALASLLAAPRPRLPGGEGVLIRVARWSRRWAPRWFPTPVAAERRIAAAGWSPTLT